MNGRGCDPPTVGNEAHAEKEKSKMYPRLTGLVAAPFTPFHADGELNLAVIEKQAEYLVRTNVRGAFVCGTTGEGMSMTIEERKRVAARWVEVAGKQLSIIVHIGHTSLGDVRELAGHAQKIGAHAVSAMGPCFFRPASVSDLVDYCRDAAGASPGLPFYYYHIPVMTGVGFAMNDFLAQSIGRVPTLAGVNRRVVRGWVLRPPAPPPRWPGGTARWTAAADSPGSSCPAS